MSSSNNNNDGKNSSKISGGSGEKGKKRNKNSNNHKTKDQVTKMNIPTRQRVVSEMSEGDASSEDLCQLCMNRIEVWSIGPCNHVICHVCSTRMRVLCQRNECAICRSDMPKVIFTLAKLKFEDIKDNIYPMDRKYKICFETEEIQNMYTDMLSHKCPVCGLIFKTYRQLDQHLRREHEMYFCDLCVNNLTLFTHERKYYNRKDLVEHRRKGDPDDSSFKGHPLCEFCDERFFDDEALFKHLRKDHYFCHFCDADGFQYFYAEYADLRRHFEKDHFLCKEPECEEQKFVVFRTEIDFKGHCLERHSGAMSKAASKEARKVELEFNFNRHDDRGGGGARGRDRGGRGRGYDRRDRDRDRDREETPEYHDQLDGPVRSGHVAPEHVPDLVSDFPSLSGAPARPRAPATSGASQPPQSWSNKSGSAANNVEEFPSLPGARPVDPTPLQSKPKKTTPEPSSKLKPKPAKSKAEEFPGLPASSKSISKNSFKPKPVIKTSPSPQPQPQPAKKPTVNVDKSRRYEDDDDEDDYPSLSGPSINLNNFSRKTVQSSGQDLNYSTAQVSSNIKTVDKSVLEQFKSNNSNSGSKPSVNSTSDFPGLGKPQQKLDLNFTKKAGKKAKNANKNNNDNSYASKSKEVNVKDDKSSLNSICDFLGGGATVTVKESKPKSKPTEEAKVQPLKSKIVEEEVFRPSKSKPSNVNNNNGEVTSNNKPKQNGESSEDFPTLGKASKKLSRNFVSAEEKIVQKKSVFNQWGKNINNVEQSLQNTHISNRQGSPKKAAFPPGFSRRNNFKYSAPSDFQERNKGLITTITDLIGGKSLEFKTFKDISGKFRAGQMESDVYYVECKQLMNKKQFNKVFPELLSLLPDIQKQQDLFELYRQDSWFDGEVISECEVCQQINLAKDQTSHLDNHSIDEDFPQL